MSGATPVARDLGRSYTLEVSLRGGPPILCTLVVGEHRMRAVPHAIRAWGAGPFAFGAELVVSFDQVRRVVACASHVDVESIRGAELRVVELRPLYADRERLLWELAVRVPDAVERGIPERESGRPAGALPSHGCVASPAPAPLRPALPPTGPRLEGATPPQGDPRALTGLDDAMAGLGSALVGERPTTPAPPRSGLGCGLFVTEPRDDEDDAPPRA